MNDMPRGEIFIVDDDAAIRDALSMVFMTEGYNVKSFADGASFLEAAHANAPACILLDVQMPGMSGLDVLKRLNAEHYSAPIFVISGQGDIPMAVDAIKHGAFDFVEKPFRVDAVVARVNEAIAAWVKRVSSGCIPPLTDFPGRDTLTPREREVLGQIASGASNKEAGRALGISPRTIEVHRARIMEKLGAKNAADLVRIVLDNGRAH